MAPDVNSLPPSRSTSASPMTTQATPPVAPSEGLRGQDPSPSSRSPSVSLAAAATINAADRSRRSSASLSRSSPRPSRASERRRSNVAMNLNLNDPSLPGPGELASGDHRTSLGQGFRTSSPTSIGPNTAIASGDPHHQRTPSLGELHQELEQEQEAQVNRLLQMIRQQQAQLQQLQAQQQTPHGQSPMLSQSQPSALATASGTAIDDSTPTSERSFSLPMPVPLPYHTPSVHSAATPRHRASRPTSQTTSPALRPLRQISHDSISEFPTLGSFPTSPQDASRRRSSREESSAFYQAETANLTRENQMLRHRIRELERQVNDMKERGESGGPQTPPNHHGSLTGTARDSIPAQPSNLATTSSQSEGGTGLTAGAIESGEGQA
ncbi:MAG: hypothetical protein Q9227_001595 [Pyrenula ochraceoflavens]